MDGCRGGWPGPDSVHHLRLAARFSLILALGALAPTIAAAVGGPRRLPGRQACLSEGGREGCAVGRGLRRASWVTVSGDGRSVYVGAQDSGAVVVLARNARTGALVQLPGRAGCVATGGADGCARGRALATVRPVAVAPDGGSVYAGTGAGVAAFARSVRTGALRQLARRAGCVAEGGGHGCATGRGVAGTRALGLSRDGRFLYAAGNGADAVAVFARDRRSGALRQLGCLTEHARPGCRRGRGLVGPRSVTLTPDQRFVYVTGEFGDSIAVFARSARTGALRQLPGRAGCLQSHGADGCAPGRALRSPHELILSPDGRFAYVASDDSDGVAVLRRSATTGTLHQLPGRAGCVEEGHYEGCTPGRALGNAHSLAMSPDGDRLYVAGNAADAIATFAVDRRSGTLHQLPGAAACTGSTSGCTPAPGLHGVHQLAVYGRFLYAASEGSDAVAALAR